MGEILEGGGGGAFARLAVRRSGGGSDDGMDGWVVGRVCWAVVTLRGWGWRTGMGWNSIEMDWSWTGFGRIWTDFI